MRNRIALNTLFQIMARGLELASGAWVNAWIARQWGAAIFGQIGFVSSLLGLGSFLFSLGSEVLLVRLIAREKEKARHYLLQALCLMLPLSLIGSFLLVAVGVMLSSRAYLLVLMLACLQLTFATASLLLQACFYAYERMEWEGLLSLSERGVWVVLGFWLALQPPSLVAMFGVLAFCKGLRLLLGGGLFLRIVPPRTRPVRLDWRELADLVRQSFPFGLELLFSTVYASADILLLSLWVGEAQTGVYRAAAMLIAPIVMLAVSFNNAFYPRLSVQAREHPERLSAQGRLATRLVLMGAAPLTLFMLLFAGPVVQVLFGSRYEAAVPILQFLSLLLPLRFLNNSLTTILWATDRQGAQMKGEGIAAVCSLSLNALLIPRLGVFGACLAALLTDLLRLLILGYFLRRFGWKPRDFSLFAGCFFLAGGILLPLASLPWVAAAGLLALLYPVSLPLFRLFTRADLRLLQAS